jgi:hypothetical protein
MATPRRSPLIRDGLKFDQSADLLAELFSELDLLDDAEVPALEVVLLPFVPDEDDDDSDLLEVSDVDVSDFEDSAFDASALVESAFESALAESAFEASALAASTFEVSPFDLA